MSPQPSTLTDRAYAAIKRRLIRLDIPPGAVFTESKMAAELGLGKTPVREALMRLQREGLVEVLARSGYRAAPVTLRDVKELMALRAILECEAASQAAQAMKDPHQLRSLDALCRVDYEPHDRASISRFLRANTEFHVTIAEASGNRRLARTLERLLHELERIFHLGLALTSRTQEIVHEHESLVDAIMRGDAASAREIALAQCQASQKMVLDALLSSPSLLSANIAIAPSQPAGRRSSAAPVTSSPRTRGGLGYIFDAALQRSPEKVAIYQGDVEVTYRDLEQQANRVANGLLSRGIARGDRVALLFDNDYRYIETSLGIMRSGAIAVPINPRLGNDAIAYIIDHSDAKMLFCSPNETARGASLAEGVAAVRAVIGFPAHPSAQMPKGVLEFAAWVAPSSPEPPAIVVDALADAFQPYTSGSTGRPKGCVLNHDGQIWNTRVHVDFLGYTGEDRSIAAAPLSHKNAMTGAVKPMLYAGGSVVILPRFDPEAYIAAIDRYKITYTTGVPAMYNMILARPELFEHYDVSSVRIATVGSSSVPPELLRLMHRYFTRAHVAEIYGSTEGGPVTLIQPLDDTPGMLPVAETEIAIVRDDGGECEDDEIGELIVRNRGVLRAYYKNEGVSAERIRDRWYHTRDLTKRTRSGRYFIMGRTDDMIITAAENVYPIEVEDLLRRHPAVADAVVVPVPHAVKGQVPVAFVVLHRGVETSEEAIKAFALEHGPAFAHPRRVFFMQEIPLSGPGKVDRKRLCELAGAAVEGNIGS